MNPNARAREVAEQLSRDLNLASGDSDLIADRLLTFAQEQESEKVKELVEGLKPFAEIGKLLSPNLTNNYTNTMAWAVPEVGHLRHAAALIAKHSVKGEKG